MSEELIKNILSVDIRVKTNSGKKKTIKITDFVNEFGTLSVRPNFDPYNGKKKYIIELEIECDDYSTNY